MMLNAESGLIIWEILKFAVLLVVLWLYAWKPLMAALKKRETMIQHAMENAEQAKREAEIILKNNQNALLQANLEFEGIRQRSEPLINEIRDAAIAAAKKQVDSILNATKEEIQRMKGRAIQQLRAEIGGLAVDCAGVIVNNIVDSERHRKLIDRALDSIPFAPISDERE